MQQYTSVLIKMETLATDGTIFYVYSVCAK